MRIVEGGGGILDLCRVFSSVDRSTRLEKFKVFFEFIVIVGFVMKLYREGTMKDIKGKEKLFAR